MRHSSALCAFLACLTLASPTLARAESPDPIGDLIQSVVSAPANAVRWLMKATVYHAGASGVGSRDAMGCRPVAMRTVAVDRRLTPLGSKLFIKETVGLPMPNGGLHDGVWYASDTGGAIKGQRIDLYTGDGSRSVAPLRGLNLTHLTVAKVGDFKGCPPA